MGLRRGGKLRIGLGGLRPGWRFGCGGRVHGKSIPSVQERFPRGATVLIRLMGRDRNRGVSVPRSDRNRTEVIGGPCHPLKVTLPPTLRFFISVWESQSHQKNEVTWPGGNSEFADLAVDRRYTVVQPDAGCRSEKNEDRVALFINETRRPSHRYATPGKPRR